MSAVLYVLVGAWVGCALGVIVAGLLHSSSDADRDCYWQEVATVLSCWAWGAAHSHGVSEICHDEKPSRTLDRAVIYVNRARRES
jgi:hypothetical protein